jgi:O-antigen/teichoic acid export membrane protein
MTRPASPVATAGTAAQRAAFFRQSGWMMLSTIIGGILMWSVHLLSKKIPAAEYGTLITLFAVVNMIPTLPLQMVFTQQTARALASGGEAQLSGLIRRFWLGILLLWMAGAAVVWVFHQGIATGWHLANPAALPLVLLAILLSLWWPVLAGVMQGRQNFLWLGWCTILNAAARIGPAVLIVFVWHGWATGIMVAVALGLLVATGIGVWQTQTFWRTASAPFDRSLVLGQVVPLMLGFAATQFLFSADTAYVNHYFGSEKTAPYGAAGTLSRALLWLVLPLAGVMFPKIVHSTVTSQKTSLVGIALLVTGVLAALGFLGLWLLGPWLVPLVFPPSYTRETLAVLPWYAGAMIPLALGNVLVNDLLARGRFKIVPALVLLAAAYGLVLARFHASPAQILQLLGAFNLLLLAVCAAFVRWTGK